MAKQFLIKNTMAEMRNLCACEIAELRDGTYLGLQLLGYYQAGDTPDPINYYLSTTSDPDDGGSVIAVGGVKLIHRFIGMVDIRYFGAQVSTNINQVFDKAKRVADHLLIDDQYTITSPLEINKSNFKLELSSRCILQKTSLTNGDGIKVAADLTNVVIEGQGTILGNMDSNRVGYAIAVGNNTSNGEIKGIRMDGWTGGVLLNHNNRDWNFTLNSFYNMTYVPEVKAGGYGIVFQESYDTLTTENYFDETVQRHHIYYAINTDLSTKGGENHVLSNNIFLMQNKAEYITGFEYSVKIMAAKNVTCTGNVLEGGVGGFWITSFFPNEGPATLVIDPDTINISGNTIRGLRKGNSGYGAAVGSHGSHTMVRNLNIVGNTITDCESGRADIDFGRVVNCNISGNVIEAKDGTNFGIYIDITAQHLTVDNNIIHGHNRGFYIVKNSNNTELDPKVIRISNCNIAAKNFCIFQQHSQFDTTFEIINNYLESTSGAPVYIMYNTTGLKISDNTFKNLSTSSNIILKEGQFADSYIYNNVFTFNRHIPIDNLGSGYVFQPLNIQNLQTTLANLPTTNTRTWIKGDRILNSDTSQKGWLRITNGTGNIINTDWILD
ncbi:MAG: hypothetical protein K0R59_3206 [Sphingobacterium sp.]|jgi:hypothetical protein|nr:hypothetical protein [Sphingobacterium sp.]